MITWMQKHKKYLVVTIWVSTIAFVGAGFVGWGAYDFNKSRATSIAKVGDIDISYQRFEQTYAKLFNYYSQLSQRQLSQEEAEQLGLVNIATQSLIDQALLLNYAKDLGLDISDEELISELIKTPSFQKDGTFDTKTYQSTLQRLKITPKEYENELKDNLLAQKLLSTLGLKADTLAQELLNADISMSDTIKAKVILATLPKISEDEIKQSWDKNKDLYLSSQKYELNTHFIPAAKDEKIDENALKAYYDENRADYKDGSDKIMPFEEAKSAVMADLAFKNAKKGALEEYLKIKKGDKNASEILIIDSANANDFPLDELKDAKEGEVLKPFTYKNGYLIAKIAKIIAPQPKSYEEAKADVLSALQLKKMRENLQANAKASLEKKEELKQKIKISKDSDENILGLSQEESIEFISKVFASTDKSGYILLNDKAVVYEIIEQNLFTPNKQFASLLASNAANIKKSQLEQGLILALQKQYIIKKYYK